MTSLYKLVFKKSAEKELRTIPRSDLVKIMEKVGHLSGDPRPLGCVCLSGREGFRIRQGSWRVIYTIDDAARKMNYPGLKPVVSDSLLDAIKFNKRLANTPPPLEDGAPCRPYPGLKAGTCGQVGVTVIKVGQRGSVYRA